MPKLFQYDGKKWVEIAKNGENGISPTPIDEKAIIEKAVEGVIESDDWSELEKEVKYLKLNQNPKQQRGGAGTSLNGISKTLTYNADGTLNKVTDSLGTKTMVYSSGVLTGIIGTGNYRNKSFTYSSGALTAVTVS